MLASSEIIEAVADTWRGSGNPAGVPRRRSSSTRCAHPCTAIHCCIRQPFEAFRTSLFHWRPWCAQSRRGATARRVDVVDGKTQRNAARALHSLGPKWTLVKGGHLRSAPDSQDVLYDGTDLRIDAPRVGTTHDRRGDTLSAAIACALARPADAQRGRLRQGLGHRSVCAAAYPLGSGHGAGVGDVQAG